MYKPAYCMGNDVFVYCLPDFRIWKRRQTASPHPRRPKKMSPQTFCKIRKLSLSADNSINGRTLAARLPDKLMRPWSGPTSQYVAWSAETKESGARSGALPAWFKLDHFPPIPFLHRPTLDEIEATIWLVVELHPILKICARHHWIRISPHFAGWETPKKSLPLPAPSSRH